MTGTAIHASGRKIAYDIAGTTGRPMVFVHGRSSRRSYFTDQMEHFARNHRVVTVDLQGHGDSDPSADPTTTTIADFSDDIATVVDHLGLESPIVVGHSMGSDVALECAARGGFAGAVLLDPFLNLGHELDDYFANEAKTVLADDDGAYRRKLIEYLFPPTDTVRRDEIIEDFVAVPKEVDVGCSHAMGGFDANAALAALSTPLLVVFATNDAAPAATEAPPRVTDVYPTALTGTTVGSGHFIQIQVPDQVNAMIERFIAVSGIDGTLDQHHG